MIQGIQGSGIGGGAGSRGGGLASLQMTIPPLSMRLDYELPRMEIEQTEPRVLLDQREALEDIGLETHLTQARRYAEMGRHAALLATARWAREGDELRDPQWGFDGVSQAKERSTPSPKEINVDVAPKRTVQVHVVPGEVRARVTPGRVSVSVPFQRVQVYFPDGWLGRLRAGVRA